MGEPEMCPSLHAGLWDDEPIRCNKLAGHYGRDRHHKGQAGPLEDITWTDADALPHSDRGDES